MGNEMKCLGVGRRGVGCDSIVFNLASYIYVSFCFPDRFRVGSHFLGA